MHVVENEPLALVELRRIQGDALECARDLGVRDLVPEKAAEGLRVGRGDMLCAKPQVRADGGVVGAHLLEVLPSFVRITPIPLGAYTVSPLDFLVGLTAEILDVYRLVGVCSTDGLGGRIGASVPPRWAEEIRLEPRVDQRALARLLQTDDRYVRLAGGELPILALDAVPQRAHSRGNVGGGVGAAKIRERPKSCEHYVERTQCIEERTSIRGSHGTRTLAEPGHDWKDGSIQCSAPSPS